ncbi:MAG: hypothetical protein MJE63_33375 [Proteobacteria bacterium]|nr:hypothetical protein [Pseudomonadota bacterium]
MRTNILVILLTLTVLIAPNTLAKGWVSVSLPTIYRFSQKDDSFFSSGSTLSGKPSGFILHGSIFEMPFAGYEKYQITLQGDDSDEVDAIIDAVVYVEFFDIGLHFEQKNTHILIGYGYGSLKTECDLTTCSTIDFDEGIARQYFAQLGVEIVDNLNLHLSAHRITGQQDISSGTTSDHLVLDGMMYAFGLKLGW